MRRRKKEQLTSGDDRIASHVFDALDTPPRVFEERIGGAVMVVEKTPADGPITLMTAGLSRLPVDAGLPVELAVEVVDGQQNAALHVMQMVCNDIATKRRTPPMGSPYRSPHPILADTGIHALVATTSRHGDAFDTVRADDGTAIGRVVTLRLLTYGESWVVSSRGCDALVELAGGVDALLDVTRPGTTPDLEDLLTRPVVMSKLHSQFPPRWITLEKSEMFTSVTGRESAEYMADNSNHEATSVGNLIDRFPWVAAFIQVATPGMVARFEDASGRYILDK